MKTEVIEPPTLDVNELIQSLLGLQPVNTAKTSSADRGASALRELGHGVRRALEIVLQVGDRESASFRLYKSSAEAPLVTVFAWALAMPYRRVRELPYAPLELAEDGASEPPLRLHRRWRDMSIDELIAAHWASPKSRQAQVRDLRAPTNQFPADRMVDVLFGVEPKTLFNLRRRPHLGLDKGRSPEELARGFERLATDVLRQYKMMCERATSVIQLMSESDATDADILQARAAHIATLLAAALFAAGDHEVEFIASRPWSDERKTALRETAKAVYRDFSEEALRGFELICDGYVHFGHGYNQTIAEKLLVDVARECDPALERVPYCVAFQLSLQEIADLA